MTGPNRKRAPCLPPAEWADTTGRALWNLSLIMRQIAESETTGKEKAKPLGRAPAKHASTGGSEQVTPVTEDSTDVPQS